MKILCINCIFGCCVREERRQHCGQYLHAFFDTPCSKIFSGTQNILPLNIVFKPFEMDKRENNRKTDKMKRNNNYENDIKLKLTSSNVINIFLFSFCFLFMTTRSLQSVLDEFGLVDKTSLIRLSF